MKREEQHHRNSFVLRIWWEEGTQPHQWRGWVQHAATGETRCFRRLTDLLAFVEAHTGPLAQAPDAEADEAGKGGVESSTLRPHRSTNVPIY